LIQVRSAREISLIRKSCEVVSGALAIARGFIKPGITTKKIDQEIERFILSRGGKPAFKGYNGFPASSCISVDEEVVHGIPGDRALLPGQIVGVDIGVVMDGYYGDSAMTFAVGEIDKEKQRLMDVTKESLYAGLERVKAGERLSNISNAIQRKVEEAKFSVVRALVGHGIGEHLHEDPQIPNYGPANSGPRLKSGMVLAIEPMVNMGDFDIATKDDEWTVVTSDGLPSAHFEHTVVVTDNGPEILTVHS